MNHYYNSKLENSIILITGGTGSFGKTMLQALLKMPVKEIRILSRDEKKQEELRFQFNDDRLKLFIGDVRDRSSIDRVIKNVDYVFHAAALKQVPSCEFNPSEAVYTNIIGATNLIDRSIQANVKSIVVLSTDKAVYPINAMGISKAMMEKIAISRARECYFNNVETKINVTRYGNVMGSRGSVIPLFISRIKNNLPIIITDPKMTRFMMTLDESVDLVLHAFCDAKQGDTVIRKSAGATVLDIAVALKNIFNSTSNIEIVGPRHGEKMHESLCTAEEMVVAKDKIDFFEIPADLRPLTDYTKKSRLVDNISPQSYSSDLTYRLTVEELVSKLLMLDAVKIELQ